MWSSTRRPTSQADPGRAALSARPDGETEPVDGRRVGRRVPWWVPALAVLLAVVAVVAVGLLRPGGTVSGDDSEHYQINTPLPPVQVDKPYVGKIVATEDHLTGVSVILATYMGTIRCGLDARLVDDLTGAVVGTGALDCNTIGDNTETRVLSFAPVRHSAGRTYDLTLSIAPGSVIGPSMWTTSEHKDAIVLAYDPEAHMAGHLGQVLDRIAAYGPAWTTPMGLLAILVFGAASMVLLLARPRWGLVAVLVLVLLRGLLWSALIPPLQGMDEGAHFASVQYIATQGKLPNLQAPGKPSQPYSDSLIVASQGMHVSAIAPTDRPDYSPDAVRDLAFADAAAGTRSDGTGPAAGYPPGYYAPAALFYLAAPDNTVAQVHAIRLWSVLLGVAATGLAWLFGLEVFGRRRWAQAGLAVSVALQPMIAHQFAIVNNDALVMVAAFAALWIGVRLTREARAGRLMLLAGAVVGMGLLGKPFALAAVIPVAIGWCLGKVRYRVTDWRALVREPVFAAAGVAATYGVWIVAARLLGIAVSNGFPSVPGPAGSRTLTVYLATQYDPAFLEFRGIWVDQFWGNFGWVNTPLPHAVYTVIWCFYLAIAAAVVAWVAVLPIRRLRTPEIAQLDRLITVCVGFGVGTLVLLYWIEYVYFVSVGRTDLLQGRYALMTVPALLALPGLLTARLSRGKLGPTVPTLVVASGVFVLQAIAIGVVVRHYYL
jgi:hypothetical protein